MLAKGCHKSLKVFSPSTTRQRVAKRLQARFKMTMLEIYNLNESMTMLALKRELRPSQFIYSLDKTYPKSYSESLTHAKSTFA